MRYSKLLGLASALAVGLCAACYDCAVNPGHNPPTVTIFLLLLGGMIAGYTAPAKPWRWMLLVGIWMPTAHLMLHLIGIQDYVTPNTYQARFALVPVGLIVAGIGTYLGAILRSGSEGFHKQMDGAG